MTKKVYLVWENAPWQGDTLRGAFPDRPLAESAITAWTRDKTYWSIEPVAVSDDVGEPLNLWHGN